MIGSSNKNSRFEMLMEAGVIAAFVVVAVLVTIGLGVWFLISEASSGSEAALIVITILGTLLIMGVSFAIFWGTLKVNQAQDERAMKMQIELMQVNALENASIMQEIQKSMLLVQKTNEAENRARLLASKVDAANQPQPQNGLTTIPGAFDGLE